MCTVYHTNCIICQQIYVLYDTEYMNRNENYLFLFEFVVCRHVIWLSRPLSSWKQS